MGLSEVVDLTITLTTASPTRAGFGTPLLLAYTTVPANLVTLYSDLAGMVSDGFALTDPAYLMASAVFSQNPRPPQVAIGKRTLAYTQTIKLTPVKLTVGYHYKFTFVSPLGVSTVIEYVVQPSDTVALIATAIVALFTGIVGVTAATVGSPVTAFTLTAAAGKLFNLTGLPLPQDLTVLDTTTDPGIATDLTAIEAFDSTSWYGAALDHSGAAEVAAAAAWIESRRRIALFNTSDSGCVDNAITSDIGTAEKSHSYVRSDLLQSSTALQQYSAAAWLGKMLTYAPGSATWAFKTLAGIVPDNLSTNQKAAAVTKNVNTYTVLGGLAVTQWGEAANGGYTDVCVGTDWLYARIQEDLFALFASADKIPYTDSGVDTVRNVVLARLNGATEAPNKFLAPSPAPTVSFPKVKDVQTTDKANRLLPDGTATATLTGAIHKVKLTISLSV